MNLGGARLKETNGPAATFGRFDGMRTENTEGVSVASD